MAKINCVLFFCVVAASLRVSSALSDNEIAGIKAFLKPVLEYCGKELNITKEEILAAKEAEDIDALDPCFYACYFRKCKLVNEKGFYVPDEIKEKRRKFIKDEEFIQRVEAISETCKAINEKPVNDGEKGCERSKMLVECFHENKAGFTAFIE